MKTRLLLEIIPHDGRILLGDLIGWERVAERRAQKAVVTEIRNRLMSGGCNVAVIVTSDAPKNSE